MIMDVCPFRDDRQRGGHNGERHLAATSAKSRQRRSADPKGLHADPFSGDTPTGCRGLRLIRLDSSTRPAPAVDLSTVTTGNTRPTSTDNRAPATRWQIGYGRAAASDPRQWLSRSSGTCEYRDNDKRRHDRRAGPPVPFPIGIDPAGTGRQGRRERTSVGLPGTGLCSRLINSVTRALPAAASARGLRESAPAPFDWWSGSS